MTLMPLWPERSQTIRDVIPGVPYQGGPEQLRRKPGTLAGPAMAIQTPLQRPSGHVKSVVHRSFPGSKHAKQCCGEGQDRDKTPVPGRGHRKSKKRHKQPCHHNRDAKADVAHHENRGESLSTLTR